MKKFDYETATSRNIGWITEWEQAILKTKSVGIAGMGGAGGFHLMTLVRLGVTKFKISDGDEFEIHNFNRQFGAKMSNVGRNKAEVMREEALDINPNCEIQTYDFIDEHNVDEFLEGIDIYVDGVDFFSIDARMVIFKKCEEKKIPVITVAPIGMGCTCLVYDPSKPLTLTKYFDLKEGDSKENNILKFITGLSPNLYHAKYLQERDRIDFENHKGPSSITSCQISAGLMVGEFIKLMLGRGKIYSIPYYHQFDAYLNKRKLGYLVLGNRNPIQTLKRYVIERMALKNTPRRDAPVAENKNQSTIEKILDCARWAPSGDNTQPWRFEIVDSKRVKILILSEDKLNVYDYAGNPTLYSIGCLLETMKIAASVHHLQMNWSYHSSDGNQYLDVKFNNADIKPDELVGFLKHRSVNRSAYQTKAIDQASLNKLAACLDEDIKLKIYSARSDRWFFAKLNSLATKIRLQIPETYEIHKAVLSQKNHAKYGVPVSCVGASPMTQKLMLWAMKSWKRIDFLNKYLAGTTNPRIEMDIIPGLNSFGQFTFTKEGLDYQDHETAIRIGMNIQRFWLTATKIGIAMQPTLAPQMFAYYARKNQKFSTHPKAFALATKLNALLSKKVKPEELCFMGRIGWPKIHLSNQRSGRLDLNDLIINVHEDALVEVNIDTEES